MTAPNPVMNANRPATTEAATGREAASHLTTTSAGAVTAYQLGDWTLLDEVTLDPNPDLADELAGESCDWCGWLDRPARFRVWGPWMVAQDVCSTCVGDCASFAASSGAVTVETAS